MQMKHRRMQTEEAEMAEPMNQHKEEVAEAPPTARRMAQLMA
jgi:hypothetical protein